jgi:hypothetical protein
LEHADFVRLWWGGSQIRNSFCLAVFAWFKTK